MTTITFGLRTESIDDPLVGRALALSREFMFAFLRYLCSHFLIYISIRNCTGPMSNLVDFLPILQRIPSPMQIRGKKLHNGLVETYGGIIKDIERKLNRGVVVEDCLAKTMLQTRQEEDLDDLDMAILASAFMIGGVETVS